MSDLLPAGAGTPAGHDAALARSKTSTAFAALIGGPVPGEKAGLMALVAIGAVMMEWTG